MFIVRLMPSATLRPLLDGLTSFFGGFEGVLSKMRFGILVAFFCLRYVLCFIGLLRVLNCVTYLRDRGVLGIQSTLT